MQSGVQTSTVSKTLCEQGGCNLNLNACTVASVPASNVKSLGTRDGAVPSIREHSLVSLLYEMLGSVPSVQSASRKMKDVLTCYVRDALTAFVGAVWAHQ